MSVRLKGGGRANEDDLMHLAQVVGLPIAVEFLEFVRKEDGARPENNVFRVDAKDESGVDSFIPVREIPAELDAIENLPAGAFPVAWAEGGNYVLLLPSGEVEFWDHELAKRSKIADNFAAFVAALRVFDPDSVELKPGQVKSGWIDPMFFKPSKGGGSP